MQTTKTKGPVPSAPFAQSPSKTATANCPYRYQQLFLEGNRDLERPELALGKLLHELSRSYLEHLRDAGLDTDLEKLRSLTRVHWETRESIVAEHLFEDYDLLSGDLENIRVNPDEIAYIEEPLAFNSAWAPTGFDDDDCAFAGIMDLGLVRDDEAEIIDWTTANIAGGHGALKELQARRYGLLFHKLTGVERITTRIHSFRSGRDLVVELDRHDHEKTRSDWEKARQRIMDLPEQQGSLSWPAVPGDQCHICSLKCAAVDFALAIDSPIRMESPEHAQIALQHLVVLNQRRKQLMAVLQGYSGAHGAVEGNGMIAGYFPTKSKEYDVRLADVVLGKYGIDPKAAVKLQKSGITKLAAYKALRRDARKELMRELDECQEVTVGERWDVKRATEGP